jgi:hypothetical protein
VKHQLLLALRVHHDAYPRGRCTGLQVEPRSWSASGMRALARHRLLARPQIDGLDVLGRVDARGRPFLEFQDLSLAFDLVLRDRELLHRSDLALIRKLASPTWKRSRSGERLKLRAGTTPLPSRVFGAVELDKIDSGWLRSPRHFVIEIPATQVLVIYYLIGPRGGPAPQIVDADGKRSLAFTCETLVEGPELARRDPVGAALLAHHGDRSVHRLSSDKAIVTQPSALRGLGLRVGDRLLRSDLPSPAHHQHITIAPSAESKARDALYHVLEY